MGANGAYFLLWGAEYMRVMKKKIEKNLSVLKSKLNSKFKTKSMNSPSKNSNTNRSKNGEGSVIGTFTGAVVTQG